jgi:hypothetical protein
MVMRFVKITNEYGESTGVSVLGDSQEAVKSLGRKPIRFRE